LENSVSRCSKGIEESGIPGGVVVACEELAKGGGARPVVAARQERRAREPGAREANGGKKRRGEPKNPKQRRSRAVTPSGTQDGCQCLPGYG